MVCGNAKKALQLNESESTPDRYILEGLFAGPFGVENRNKRIYQLDEYMKHLQYLRDDIKNGEPLLGELDHPEDRFEVKLKDVSHKVIDLWYDKNTNTIQGKVELLNTPNGKLAQSLVDQGIPLHISSRAAGTVNGDKTVSIQQIYTFDLVCKPGFAGAVLHRVNESADATSYTEETYKFLTESQKSESMNVAPQFGILNEDVSITEVNSDAKIREEAKEIQECGDAEKTEEKTSQQEDNMDEKEKINLSEKEEEEKNTEKDTDTEENKDDDNSEEKESDEEKEEGVEILSVRAEIEGEDEDEEGVEIEDVKAEETDKEEDSDNEEEKEEEETEETKEEKKESTTEEEVTVETNDEEKDIEKKKLFDCDDISKRREKFEDKLDDLIDAIKTKGEKKKTDESITINKYPLSSMLNEGNFASFMKLSESQKNNVIAYLQNNMYGTIDSVNENWENGIDYNPDKEVWLTHAPERYKALYENATEEERESIKTTASFVLFESQSDINRFWENSGLTEKTEKRMLHESFINNMPKIATPVETNTMPYGNNFIDTVVKMACDYNE